MKPTFFHFLFFAGGKIIFCGKTWLWNVRLRKPAVNKESFAFQFLSQMPIYGWNIYVFVYDFSRLTFTNKFQSRIHFFPFPEPSVFFVTIFVMGFFLGSMVSFLIPVVFSQ